VSEHLEPVARECEQKVTRFTGDQFDDEASTGGAPQIGGGALSERGRLQSRSIPG
jgi:hypothetical protein